jgi:hypothetical protein
MLMKNNIKNVETVHKFLKGKMVYDEDGKEKYTFNPDTISDSLIFVDECSMINNEIYNQLEKYARNNFIIFSGDSLQLPPIESPEDEEFNFKNKKSKTFDKSKCEQCFELTENMRARQNPIGAALINKARESIKLNSIPDFIAKINIETVLKYIKKDNLKDFVVLAYSNARVNYYNKLIRAYLFNSGNETDLKEYYVNESLVFTGCRKISDLRKYNTSDIITVKSVETEEIELFYEKCKCYTYFTECEDCGIVNHKEKSLKIKFWKLVDENKVVWYKPFDENNRKVFYKLSKHFKDHCKKIRKGDIWARYYSFYYKYNSDLRYTYSSTIHKSQGDEWDYVFLDRNNLIKCAKETMLRLTSYYTAVSRMKNEVYEIV